MTSPIRHVTVETCATYDEAFHVAARIAKKKRKESWRGCVRIRYRGGVFQVQVRSESTAE
jgi:hypothetical protein